MLFHNLIFLILVIILIHVVHGQGYDLRQSDGKPYTMVTYLCHKQPSLSLCDPYNKYKVLSLKQLNDVHYNYKYRNLDKPLDDPIPTPPPFPIPDWLKQKKYNDEASDINEEIIGDIPKVIVKRKARKEKKEETEETPEKTTESRGRHSKKKHEEPVEVTEEPEIEEDGKHLAADLPEPEPDNDNDTKKDDGKSTLIAKQQEAYKKYLYYYQKYVETLQEDNHRTYYPYPQAAQRIQYYPQQQQQQYYQQQQPYSGNNGVGQLGIGTQMQLPYVGGLGWSTGVWGK